MALAKCKECGNQISTTAKVCPQCGAAAPKKTSVVTWVIGGIFAIGVIGALSSTGEHQSTSNSVHASTGQTPSALPTLAALPEAEKKAIVGEAMKGLEVQRDAMEKVSFYEAKGRNLLASSLSAYVAVGDASTPFLRVRSVYYGDDWVFYEKIKVMADDQVVYEKAFNRSQVTRDNSSGSVWETADFAGSDVDLAALQRIADSKTATIRFSGSERQHDHKITKKEKENIAAVLRGYNAISTGIEARNAKPTKGA